MLLPFQWAILTLEEAELLMYYIEKTTSTPSYPKNYDKMVKLGVLDMYTKLRDFVEASKHYHGQLRHLDPSEFKTYD